MIRRDIWVVSIKFFIVNLVIYRLSLLLSILFSLRFFVTYSDTTLLSTDVEKRVKKMFVIRREGSFVTTTK